MEEFKQLKASRKAAEKLREKLIKAHQILEDADYAFTKDTMFVDYMVVAKRNLEGAINDHLLDDNYWKNKIETHILN